MKFFKPKKRRPNDKIFDNSFNKGEIDYEQYKPVEIDRSYSTERMSEFNNSFSYYQDHQLIKKIQTIFRKTTWLRSYKKNKKTPKSDLAQIYDYVYTKIKNELISDCAIFVSLADYLSVNYKTLYDLIPYKYRVQILQELDDEYNVIKKQKINKLF